MRLPRSVLAFVVLLACASSTVARDYVFQGTWHTTNRPLDGTMTCVVTDLGNEKWTGRFFGVWQGVAFDYNVPFSGPPSQLRGTALIDGANYAWTGQIREAAPNSFQGNFGGDRYFGSFDLTERTNTTQSRPGR